MTLAAQELGITYQSLREVRHLWARIQLKQSFGSVPLSNFRFSKSSMCLRAPAVPIQGLGSQRNH